jgi:hypothetical protein
MGIPGYEISVANLGHLKLIIVSIYDEIGSGERVSLTKLAIKKFEETGRPFRLAVDISIWQFQIQNGKGKIRL